MKLTNSLKTLALVGCMLLTSNAVKAGDGTEDWVKDQTKMENITVVAILVEKSTTSSTYNELLPLSMGESVYTVAGGMAGMESGRDVSLFGKAWNPALTDNDMVKGEDGIYRLEKKGYLLEAGEYQFKVVADHSWSESYPEQNVTFTVPERDSYNVTFTFNEETKEVSYTIGKPFSITFQTNADWQDVYAYVWSGNGENEVLGKWPGTKMYYNGRYTQYELSFDAMNAPEKIIFNNGNGGEGNQTGNLDFENHKTYTYYVDQPQTDTYTLAGNMTAVFGTEWDVTNTDNDMVKGEDGIWTKTYYNVEVQSGTTLEYKVVKNHSWNENWGFTYKAETNAIYEFPGMGTATYNLVFYFTPEGELPQNGMSVYCDRFLPTGISTVAADAQDAPVYNLQGMRMKSLQKGLNIVGGKKVLR